MSQEQETATLEQQWRDDPRWRGVERGYSAADVVRLRGSVPIEYTLARRGAERLWEALETEPCVRALGAVTGNQAVQMAKAGLPSIYLSGWQVAADANNAGQMYPDQSLYPANSAPDLIRRINGALARADQIHHAEGDDSIDWFLPIVADAEAGFGGVLNAFELMKDMIDAGAAGVHFEDQLSSAKKCGHMGGKVLLPDPGVGPEADRGAPCGRRLRRARLAHGAYRFAWRKAAHQRRRRARPAPSSPASGRWKGSTK